MVDVGGRTAAPPKAAAADLEIASWAIFFSDDIASCCWPLLLGTVVPLGTPLLLLITVFGILLLLLVLLPPLFVLGVLLPLELLALFGPFIIGWYGNLGDDDLEGKRKSKYKRTTRIKVCAHSEEIAVANGFQGLLCAKAETIITQYNNT